VWTTSCSRAPLEKLRVSQLVNKFPAFYGPRGFIFVLTTGFCLSLFWTGSIYCAHLHDFPLRCILIISSHACLHIKRDCVAFLCIFAAKTLYKYIVILIHATCPICSVLLNLITPLPMSVRWSHRTTAHSSLPGWPVLELPQLSSSSSPRKRCCLCVCVCGICGAGKRSSETLG
jgi:hypothetical protein